MIKIRQTIITSLFDQQVLQIFPRPRFMDITKTDWDAYEAQLADNMTKLTDLFSNLDSSDEVEKGQVFCYNKTKRESRQKIMRKLRTTCGPLNLGIFVTS